MAAGATLVSVLVPFKNAAPFLDETLRSIAEQTHRPLEASLYDDGSTDASLAIARGWCDRLQAAGVSVVLSTREDFDGPAASASAGGGDGGGDAVPPAATVGRARNRVARQSRGEFLCWLDADDFMMPERVRLQLEHAAAFPGALVGCLFAREPADATPRYAAWCNGLSDADLMDQRFRECTIIQPTWFLSRASFDAAGGYDEAGLAEDLKFFYAHIERGGSLALVRRVLLVYRHHSTSLTASVPLALLRAIRVRAFERQILAPSAGRQQWERFSIWGAGRDGKAFFRELADEYKSRVACFGDIDPAKLALGEYQDAAPAPPGGRRVFRRRIPIVHYSQMAWPFVTCVAFDRSDGVFEANLAALAARPGEDYFPFA